MRLQGSNKMKPLEGKGSHSNQITPTILPFILKIWIVGHVFMPQDLEWWVGTHEKVGQVDIYLYNSFVFGPINVLGFNSHQYSKIK